MRPVATTADELTAEWLAAALDRPVTAVELRPIGTGQMGSSYRLTLTADDDGPATLVAKLAAGDAAARAQLAIGFRKEVGFYRHVAPRVTARIPRCHHAAITDDGADFTLLLEDLSPSVPGVQADSCTVEQATATVRNLAALHASTWDDEALLALDFLEPIGAAADLFGAVLEPATATFVERYSSSLGAEDVATLHAVAAAIGRWLPDRARPFAVVHGDHRLDNLMFGAGGEVAALDWQSVGTGPPGRDLAYFVGTTFDAPDRRRHEDGLVAAYHDELTARGVTGYPLDRCAEDYRAGHLQGPLITVLGAVYATAARTDAADRMFLAMATRSCAAIRDLGSLDLVPETP